MAASMDRRALVQQYVERQKAYLPTYTAANERHGTPSKRPQSDGFGFDTPVLRPRVPVKRVEPPSESQGRKKSSSGSKRRKASIPVDTDSERAARLADRRERKRKKRAIVSPPQKQDDIVPAAAVPKKGRASGQKLKKPAALALLYGFSATNVTKDRLTLKPAPSLGVFNKGKASAKKKVTATGKSIAMVEKTVSKDSAARNDVFSESAFLNKPSERTADHAKIDSDSDDSSVSSTPMPRVIRAANRTNKNRATCTKTLKESARTTAESEVWDIEVQSKLPSSARDVSSEFDTQDSAPVVLDLRGAEWATSIKMREGHKERRNEAGTPTLSATHRQSRARSEDCGSSLAILDEFGPPHAVDAPSIHPSHSASQVGRRDTGSQPSDRRLATSQYFAEPRPISVQEFVADPPQASRLNGGIDMLDHHIPAQEDAVLDVRTIDRVVSPRHSLPSVPQSMVGFQTRYDTVPLAFPSDGSPYDDCYACSEAPCGPSGGTYVESSAVDGRGDVSAEWDQRTECRSLYPPAGSATDGVPDFASDCDPMVQECEDDLAEPCFLETDVAAYDGRRSETGQGIPMHEAASSTCSGDGDGADFLEGRALLLGMQEGGERVGLPGLVRAEMEVATWLRHHWRPVRY